MGFLILASIEVKVNNQFIPADVLTRSPKGEIEVFRTQDCTEALSHCLGIYGKVDLSIISGITDKEQDEVLRELGQMVYLNPETKLWETSDSYLAGNVYKKMLIAKWELESCKEPDLAREIQRSLNAIKDVQPNKIPWDLLEFNLGERWIPVEYYRDFCTELLEVTVKVYHFVTADKYKIESSGMHSRKAYNDWFVRSQLSHSTVNGYELLEHALENTCPKFSYTVGSGDDKVTMYDSEAIQLANQKIEDIRNEWGQWLLRLPESRKDELVDVYNNLYNCYVLRKYNGDHLKLPGIDLSKLGKNNTPIELYKSQKDTAWRIITDRGAIVDHEVGSGKSLICVIAAHEMKRMGVRTKPAILCLKANVQEIVTTYRKAYPSAKVLAPGETDFEKSNRVRLFHEMKNNDWDCIIMTHDQFGKIQQDPQIEKEIAQEEVDNLEKDLATLQKCGNIISRGMKKGLQKRKANTEVAIKKLQAQINSKKDDDINFVDIGIDHLLIDESHKFKNLAYVTRHDRVAGLGNQQGSQRATNMLYAIRTLQKRFNGDLQVTFLSGTPISNSLTEMYLLFKYLRPRELERQNISNFDAWAAVFAKKTTDFEFSVTNQIIAKERFRHFIKVPELALFYNEIADFRTKKMINIEEPEMVEELVNLPPTEDQQDYIQALINFATTGDASFIDRPPLTDGEKAAKMLIATNLAKKMSTDMRLINPALYDDHPGNKVNVCTEKVKSFYNSSTEFKGTQLIFCDMGTPGTEGFKLYEELKKKLIWSGIPAEEITFIHQWNERNKHELFKKMNDGDIRVLIGSTDKAGTGLNVQQRVVAMHQLDIPWKPAELTQRVGRGVRPGNWGAKLYQDNKVYNFIYATERSLDNYKFTLLKNKQTFISQMKQNELQVRSIDEGSIDEQSGMNFAEYIAVLSGDTTLLEKAKIDKKLAVLEKLKSAHYREISNNKYLLAHKEERLEIVTPLVKELARDDIQYQKLLTKDETGTKENPLEIPAILGVIQQEQEKWESIKKQKEEIEKNEELQPGERRAQLKELRRQEEEIKDKPVIVGEYLMKLCKLWEPSPGQDREIIGSLYGFDLYIERVNHMEREIESEATRTIYGSNAINYKNKFFAMHPGGTIKYTYNHGIPSFASSRIASRQFLNSLERISGLYETYTRERENLLRDVDGLKKMEVKSFQKEDEIIFLQGESKRLEKEIKVKIGAKPITV
jgi:N12 class adenine-specific DNA methylase